MENAFQILVIILSVFLAIFLILGIAFFLVAIKVIRTAQRISLKAEHITDKAEAVSEFVSRAAGPMLVGRIVAGFSENFLKSRKFKSKR